MAVISGSRTYDREPLEHGGWCWSLSWLDGNGRMIEEIEQAILIGKIKFWSSLGAQLVWRYPAPQVPMPAAA